MKNLHNIKQAIPLGDLQYAILWAHQDNIIQTVSLVRSTVAFSGIECNASDIHLSDWVTRDKPLFDVDKHFRITEAKQ